MVPIAFDGCFGWLHPGATDFGVVLCGPDGDEELNVRYLWLSFAEKLASAGMPTLRFDYRGTGDSIGDCWAPGQVRAWSDSVAGAVNWLRDQVGVKAVALVGLRLGAPLAVAASRELGNIDALVLLAPVVSGRTYARELRLRMKLDHALARARGRPEKVRRGGPTANEDVEAAGFVYTSETLADLERLNLFEVSRCPASRILILKRRLDTSTNERLTAHFRELGADVSEEEFVGYAAFMQPAQLAEYPRAAFDCVASWLKQFSPCRGAVSPPSTPQVQLEPSGCVEEPILFGKQLSLFGVVCRPPSVRLDVPVLMFLTTWWAPHVGQGRMWVTMARYFAQLGFTSLRLDVAGVGDSFVGLDKPNPSTRLENAIDNVQAALDWLQSKGHSRFVLIGLCWGALLARSVSLRDDRVSGQVLINLPPARETLRSYLWFVRDRLARDLKSRWRILRREKKVSPCDRHWLAQLIGGFAHSPRIGGVIGRHRAYPEHGPFVARDLNGMFDRMADLGPLYSLEQGLPSFIYPAGMAWQMTLQFYSDNNSAMDRGLGGSSLSGSRLGRRSNMVLGNASCGLS